MRVAVVDIGTNSTRLLVADVVPGGVPEEIDRRSIVTRLGEGLEASGRLGEVPIRRVFDALCQYREAIEDHGCEARVAAMTSAVRDAANGQEFAAAVRERFGLDGRTISGLEEARLTYAGATAARDPDDPTPLVVIDIGGGSTEFVAGARGTVGFHSSLQVGVVRHSERHITGDPPAAAELEALGADARAAIVSGVPAATREATRAAIAVAGTATSAAAIDLALERYDTARVEGHVLGLDRLRELRDRLAALPLAERREVTGLHPDRAPTIVAGMVILIEAIEAFDLDRVEISDRDILWGMAIAAASGGA